MKTARFGGLSGRVWLGLAVLLLLIALRITLPSIAKWVIVSQGNEMVEGTLEVEDVHFAILRGGATLENVGLRGKGDSASDELLVSFTQLYVQLRPTGLLWGDLVLQEFSLDGLVVNIDRLSNGNLVLPELTADEMEDLAEDSASGSGLGVVIERARITNGEIHLRDHITEDPVERKLRLPSIELTDLSLASQEEAAPGHLLIDAGLKEGRIRIDANFEIVPDGVDTKARIDVTKLPLNNLDVHVPMLEWSGSSGELDATLDVLLSREGAIQASGEIALRNLQIDVPSESKPALAWNSLEVEIQSIDLSKQRGVVRRVDLDGASAIVHLDQEVLLPILPRGLTTAEEESEAEELADAWTVQVEKVRVTNSGATVTSDQGPLDPKIGKLEVAQINLEDARWAIAAVSLERFSAEASLKQGKANARLGKLGLERLSGEGELWKIAEFTLADSTAGIELPDGKAELEIREVQASGLDGAANAKPATFRADLKEGSSVIGVRGSMRVDPPALKATVSLEDIALARYAVLSGASPVALSSGTLAGNLDVAYETDEARVAGELHIKELKATSLEEADKFSLAWENLDLDIDSVVVSLSNGPAPVELALASVELDRPDIRVTNTADGLALPALPGGPHDAPGKAKDKADSPATSEVDAATKDTTAETGNDDPAVEPRMSVGKVSIRDGRVQFVDLGVKPRYRGTISEFSLEASGLAAPQYTLDDLTLSLKTPGNAPFKVVATKKPGGEVDATVVLEKLPLQQFNPYAETITGYTIRDGQVGMNTKVLWNPGGYQANIGISLLDLAVGGDRSATMFRERFGMPIGVAITLLRGPGGRIRLNFPIKGSLQRGNNLSLGLTSIFAEALTQALVGALSSPLKLLGAVTTLGSKGGSVQPEPVEFVAGSTEIAPDHKDHVENIADVLSAGPQIRLEFAGEAGPADVRRLSEAAVLEELEGQNAVVSGLRNLTSGGVRDAIAKALAARAKGEPGTLDAEQSAELDTLVAEHPVTDEALRALANARATKLRATLEQTASIPERQMQIGPPQVSRSEGKPQVAVSLF